VELDEEDCGFSNTDSIFVPGFDCSFQDRGAFGLGESDSVIQHENLICKKYITIHIYI